MDTATLDTVIAVDSSHPPPQEEEDRGIRSQVRIQDTQGEGFSEP